MQKRAALEHSLSARKQRRHFDMTIAFAARIIRSIFFEKTLAKDYAGRSSMRDGLNRVSGLKGTIVTSYDG
jgi:hypothetical protein